MKKDNKFICKANEKKAQGEIITTVLIILLILAAIVIVWQVVQSTVQKGAEQVEAASSCIGMSLSITSITAPAGGTTITNVKVKRGNDALTLNSIKVIVEKKSDGSRVTTCAAQDIATGLPSAFGETTLAITCTGLTVSTDYTVRIAPKIGGEQCDIASSKDVTTPAS